MANSRTKNAIINISTAIAVQTGILWFISAARSENLFVQVLVNGVAAVILSIPFCVLVFLKNEDFRFAVDLVWTRMPFGKRRKEKGKP